MRFSLSPLFVALFAACGIWASARTYTPDEALSTALGHSPRMMMNSSANYRLAHTVTDDLQGENMIYVFDKEGADGFMVLKAVSDDANLIIGYSDTDNIDPSNMPPSFAWWLDAYAYALAHSGEQAHALRAPRQAISPLVKTQWGQEAPYNDSCPLMDGQHAVTGCVATAMAQILKAHQWPETGVGSYGYNTVYNDKNYEVYCDFSSMTFDWANMADTYGPNSTSTQKKAVADLMYACGVASHMNYTPIESGTNIITAEQGMADYLNIDRGIKYLERKWFTDDEWDALLYEQLAKAQPVLYRGSDNTGAGHAFVLDGCDANGYYHINWGWDGMADGYFLVADLNPNSQGTGGGSGSSGFVYEQSILSDIKPAQASSSQSVICAVIDHFSTQYSEYQKSVGTYITFTGGFCSYAIGTLDFTPGVRFVDSNNQEFTIESFKNASLDPGYYFDSFPLNPRSLPVGVYHAYPMLKVDGQWHEMYYNKERYPKPLTINVLSDKITVEDPYELGDISFESVSYECLDYDQPGFYVGRNYKFTFDIETTGYWSGNLAALLLDASKTTFYAASDIVNIEVDEATTLRKAFELDIPLYMPTGPAYLIIAQDTPDGYMRLSAYYELQVEELPYSGKCGVTAVEFVGSDAPGTSSESPAILKGADPKINITVKCTTAPLLDDIYFVLADAQTLKIFYESAPKTVSINNADGTQTLEFAYPADMFDENSTYAFAVFGLNQGQLSSLYYLQYKSLGTVQVNKIAFPGSSDPGTFSSRPATLYSNSPKIKVSLECVEMPWSDNVYLGFANLDGNIIATSADKAAVTFSKQGEVVELTFEGPWAGLSCDTKYIVALLGEKTKQLSKPYYFVIKEYVAVESVTLTPAQATLTIDDMIRLTATISPANATSESQTWSSSDESVATVSNGQVKAVGAGTAVITVACGNASATATITVNKKTQEITWDQTFDAVYEGTETTLTAEASSGLPVKYVIAQGGDIAKIDGNILTINGTGTIEIIASQDGDDKYMAAAAVSKTLEAMSGICDAMQGLKIRVEDNTLCVDGLKDGETISIYTAVGVMVYSGADNRIELQPNTIYVVKTPYSTLKITM